MNRMPFFDNARLILIFLVVFGHMIQPFATDSQLINSIYAFIYIFHMPMFIMLAGFFAKGIGKPKYILNLAKKLLLPYLIFLSRPQAGMSANTNQNITITLG